MHVVGGGFIIGGLVAGAMLGITAGAVMFLLGASCIAASCIRQAGAERQAAYKLAQYPSYKYNM